MKMLALKLMLSVFAISTITFAHHDFGVVRIPGEAVIKHEGDYVVYDLYFSTECFDKETDSINTVSQNVSGFVSWLKDRAYSYNDGIIDYSVNLINTYQDTNPYLGYYYDSYTEKTPNPCFQKYSTNQSISIRVEKYPDSAEINNDIVQGFYDELYAFLWPLNIYIENEHKAKSLAKITNVSKGLFEETLEKMKEQAYSYAAQIATRRFLAVLGAGYTGRWFLNKADFTNEQYFRESTFNKSSYEVAPVPGGIAAPVFPEPVPAVIVLDQLTYSINGVFEFGFTHDFNEFAPIE